MLVTLAFLSLQTVMGSSQSTKKLQSLQKQQEILMKEHAAMAKRLADEQELSKKQRQADLEQIAKLMVILVASKETKKVTKQQVEIEGVVYNITELINEGGFGQVYKAQADKGGRTVAIKIMKNSPLIQKEIETEIRFLRATKKLSIDPHPVIDYYGCKVTPELIFISLELAQCDILHFWTNEMDGRSEEEIFTFGLIIIMYTLRALAFLERLNIIHGDIKPQNLVMVPVNGSFCIKLIDFGTVEKMQTLKSLVTVDADKAHTQYFAAPEFLRRDPNKLISRRLHKKSDAWAAGVMFYLLFLRKLPWEDPYDYENFVNDPRARDIVVPELGGYKLIIELLLKKDPDERASARETLLQMKGHPVLGVLVAALERTLTPVDDVCHMRVPDSLQEELASFATPEKRAAMTTRSSSAAGSRRRSCRYGRNCYRKVPDHRAEFAHPGDRDYNASETKIPCRYGSHCYSTGNPEHMDRFSHN